MAGVHDGVVGELASRCRRRPSGRVAAGQTAVAAVEEQACPSDTEVAVDGKHWLPGVWPGAWTSSIS